MELRHIRYFLAVAEELNFTRAAERLSIAQPPLSRQIKDLEAEIGAELFVREGHRTKLTPAGLKLQQEAYSIIERCQSALRATRAVAKGYTGVISIGYMPASFCYKPFIDTLKLFQSRHPGVRLAVTQMSPAAQLEALRSQRIDFGTVHIDTALDRELDAERIFDEPIEIIFPPDHPLVARRGLCLQDVVDEPFIMMTRRWCPPFYDSFLQAWRKCRSEPMVLQETESFAVSLSLVANGMGITIGSPALRNCFTADVRGRSISDLEMRLGADLVWSRSNVSTAMQHFINAMREVKGAIQNSALNISDLQDHRVTALELSEKSLPLS